MPRNYVDNAYNRSAGRVGLPVGSAVISRSSGGGGYSSGGGYSGGGGASYGSSSSNRTYVDNAYNRSAGRAGLPVGSAVISRSSGGGGSSFGGASTSSSSSRTYVDNVYNQRAGRVGLPVGSAVISRSSGGGGSSFGGGASTSSSSSQTYLDNEYNRRAGRVGLPLGSAIISRSSGNGVSTKSENGGKSSSPKTYVDNAYNRRLGRVGLPLGSAVVSTSSRSTSTPSGKRTYVDNAFNRRLGRVGKEIGTAVYSASRRESQQCHLRPEVFQPLYDFDPEDPCISDIFEQLQQQKRQHLDDPCYVHDCEVAQGILNRHDAALTQSQSSRKLKRPTWLHGGEVIDFSDLEIGEKIGSGGFGDVHIAIWKQEYQVVVKKLRVQRVHQKKKREFEQEVGLFSNLKHPSIVEFYGACVETPNICIVMEFMAGGSLYDLLHVECRKITLPQKFAMTQDILEGLKYIHKNNIVHRDIKSMNILICEDYNHCKLGDFGLALKQENESSSSVADYSVVGTLRYSSPEMLQGERLNLEELMSADVYATSLTINELFLEAVPFEGLNQHQVRRAVLKGERPEGTGKSGSVPPLLKPLLMKGMAALNSERPKAKELLNEFKLYKDDESLTTRNFPSFSDWLSSRS